MQRVVITGMGCVTPFGFGVNTFWNALLKSENGIKKVDHLKLTGEIVNIAGTMPHIDSSCLPESLSILKNHLPEDDSILSFFMAVDEAVNDSGIDFEKYTSTDKVGAFIADRRMGEITYVEQYGSVIAQCRKEDGSIDISRFYELSKNVGKRSLFDDYDSLNHFVSRIYNITGPQLSLSTACASSNSSIGEAFIKIQSGEIDTAICGGAYNYDLNAMLGFSRLGALSKNPDPDEACKPFDARRDGFIMGSGCGILILESFEKAKRRDAKIYGEVKGYGYFSDAFRSTDPDPESKGITRTIQAALDMAGLDKNQISYINAHGTSTKMNDYSETTGIKNVFGEQAYHIPVSSTKSMIGHSIMASGALEGIVSLMSINNNIIHGTHNWKERDSKLDLDYVGDVPFREMEVTNVLSNSFGFGGQNACIVYSKF